MLVDCGGNQIKVIEDSKPVKTCSGVCRLPNITAYGMLNEGVIMFNHRFTRFILGLIVPFILILGLFAFATQRAFASTFVVDNLGDTNDANTGDGICDDGSGNCTLRAAISQANASPGADVITFRIEGTVTLTGASGEDANASGDLDITDDLTINGYGPSKTIIDANSLDRVFHVPSVVTVVLNDLTVRNGNVSGAGGGINISVSNANISFNNLHIRNNASTGNGGGYFVADNTLLTINNSTISNNTSNATGGGGAGPGDHRIYNSTISGNNSTSQGGGVAMGFVGTGNIINSTIVSNTDTSINGGGGIATWGSFTVTNSILAYNSPDNCTNLNFTVQPISNGYNISSDTSCAFSNTGDQTNMNPLLGLLQDNGGPTETHAPTSSTSPAIDQIPASNCTSAPTNGIDQRGAARNYDDGAPSTNDCDVGAFEVRESITQGTCGGPDLSGDQVFSFSSTNVVTVSVGTANGLNCITIEEMGPGVNHLMATSTGGLGVALMTQNWWHITGNINSGFVVSISLPLTVATPDANSRVCKWPGSLGGFGWDCDSGANTSFGSIDVTRTNVSSFSDWAVGDNVGPTAVTLQSLSVDPGNVLGIAIVVGVLMLGVISYWSWLRRRFSRNN